MVRQLDQFANAEKSAEAPVARPMLLDKAATPFETYLPQLRGVAFVHNIELA